MHYYVQILFTGIGDFDLILTANRIVLGLFFVLARFRWVYDPSRPADAWFNAERHANFKRKMGICGYPQSTALAAFVALTEILAGAALIVGLLTPLAAFGLFIVCLAALKCSWREKTYRQEPVDSIHVVECFLWCPEPLFVLMSFTALVGGAGSFSLDGLILSWL